MPMVDLKCPHGHVTRVWHSPHSKPPRLICDECKALERKARQRTIPDPAGADSAATRANDWAPGLASGAEAQRFDSGRLDEGSTPSLGGQTDTAAPSFDSGGGGDFGGGGATDSW